MALRLRARLPLPIAHLPPFAYPHRESKKPAAKDLCYGGAAVLSYVPRPLLGGLLLYTGLDLLSVWVVRMRRQLPPVDYAVVLLVLGVMVAGGCLPGVGAGVLVAISLC